MREGQTMVQKAVVNNWVFLTELDYFPDVHLLVVIKWF
jgi:hypothetical protein